MAQAITMATPPETLMIFEIRSRCQYHLVISMTETGVLTINDELTFTGTGDHAFYKGSAVCLIYCCFTSVLYSYRAESEL